MTPLHPATLLSTTLDHTRQLVSPEFPASKESLSALFTPDLPYIQVKFGPNKDRHPEDTIDDFAYFGCLSRKLAYPFLTTFPKYAFHLYSATQCVTYHLFLLHMDPELQPKVDPNAKIDLDDLLEPHNLRVYFRRSVHSTTLHLNQHWLRKVNSLEPAPVH